MVLQWPGGQVLLRSPLQDVQGAQGPPKHGLPQDMDPFGQADWRGNQGEMSRCIQAPQLLAQPPSI